MHLLYQISLCFTLFVLAGLFFLAFNGRKIIRHIFLTKVIAVRYDQKVSMFRAAPVFKGAIIFVGDSITEGGNWSEMFPDKKILNRGIGGDISEGVLNRIEEIIRHQPAKLFISIGTNDLAAGVEQSTIIQNYSAILNAVKTQSPETKIYVQSVLPVGKDVLYGHSNEKIVPLNATIKKLSSEMQISYIDLYPSFIDAEGYLKSSYTNDKLHLLGPAYLLWKELIEQYVKE